MKPLSLRKYCALNGGDHAADRNQYAQDHSEAVTRRLDEHGGGKHDKYEHPEKPDVTIVVPRHREQSPGVARSIAKLAGWI
ncbi:YcfA family protein (modular protein) [Mesorhizobium sp. SOD10]|nr:YcfA family protein (modular protein) [Mesorhizobium sp. SOD10]